jgi:beta-N-acetylhexosaminidase
LIIEMGGGAAEKARNLYQHRSHLKVEWSEFPEQDRRHGASPDAGFDRGRAASVARGRSRVSELSRRVGQLLSVGFDGTSVPPELRARIAASEVGGVVLFRPNVSDPAQVATLVRDLRAAAPTDLPLLVSVDQEGGLVQRVRAPATVWPAMFSVGTSGDPARTQAVGRALGAELAALGIGWNFAPVLDVHTNPANPVIGTRAFGVTPDVVTTHALAFWAGLRAAGLIGCGKHFPGHGDTRTDSHHDLPVVPHDLERLHRVELAPFKAAIAAGAEALMTAHVVYPALDPDRPATLSRRIATTLLRETLGFEGVLVSDDLGMKAVADRFSIEDIATGAITAGVDHLIIREPETRQRAAFEAMLRAAESQADFRTRVEQSAARIAALKTRCRVGMPSPAALLSSLLGTPAHKALAGSFPEAAPSAVARSPVAG